MSLMSVGTNILGYATKIDNAVINSIKKSNMSSLIARGNLFVRK